MLCNLIHRCASGSVLDALKEAGQWDNTSWVSDFPIMGTYSGEIHVGQVDVFVRKL